MKSVFSKAVQLYCWNHLVKDAEYWARIHKEHSKVSLYKQRVREMLMSESEELFDQKWVYFCSLTTEEDQMSKAFITYFNGEQK